MERRRPIPQLPIPSMQQRPQRTNCETEKRLRALKTGSLNINGVAYETNINDLEYLSELGNGTSGHVVKMRHKPSGAVLAVKQMRRTGNDEETKRITMDLDVVLKSHDCPYIVQCLGCFITEADVWIFMELMSTCFDKLQKRTRKPIPELILQHVTEATVKALYYLKSKHDVIHRDVKPSNILIDERGHIKLCDFGISGRLVDSKAKTRSAGCAGYMAPERIDPRKPEYDIRADVWSLGITLVELATAAYPYKDCKTDFEVLTKVLDSDPPSLPEDQGFSEDFKDFIKRCLTKDYRQRPKYNQLLEHRFLKNISATDVNVAEWFHNLAKEAGITLPTQDLPDSKIPSLQSMQLNSRIVSPPTTYSSIETKETKTYEAKFSFQNPFAPPGKQLTDVSDIGVKGTENPFLEAKISQQQTILTKQFKTDDSLIKDNLDGFSGNGSQNMPLTQQNDFNDGMDINYELLAKFNRLHTQSPQLPRKNYATLNNINSSAAFVHHENSRLPEDNSYHNMFHQQQPIPQKMYSPLVRKRYGADGIPVSEELEYRILHGNTSPIVLQRFYHQQNQLRDQKREEQLRAMRAASNMNNYNHAQSNIPIATSSPSYLRSTSSPSPQRSANVYEYNYNASPSSPHFNSQIPRNGSGYRYNPHYENNYNRPACPNSPQRVDLERLRANLEKPNFYERHQLPVEVHIKDNVTSGSSNGIGHDKNKGMVKTYIKTRLNADHTSKESEIKKPLTPTPSRPVPSPFNNHHSKHLPPTSSNLISSSYDRHRSPDPPMRYNRGNQSPLILRRKLELAGSPIMQRRYMSASPSPPPLIPRTRPFNNEGMNAPQHLHARIYTPEPQRRIYYGDQ